MNNGLTRVTIYANDHHSKLDYISNNLGQRGNFPKNLDDYKIYIFVTTSTENYDYRKIKEKYKNVTIGTTLDLEILEIENYDLVVISQAVWTVPVDANNIFNAGIDLISIGNDSTSALSIIEKAIPSSSIITFNQVNPIANNIITNKLNIKDESVTDSQSLINFIPDVEVLYQGKYNNISYDAIGFYEKNGTRWIHSQFSISTTSHLPHLVDTMSKEDAMSFDLQCGTYKFQIGDKAGNVENKSLTIPC